MAEVGCAGAGVAEDAAGAAVGAFTCHENTAPLKLAVIHSAPPLLAADDEAAAATELGIAVGAAVGAGAPNQLFSQVTVLPSMTAVTISTRF